jgi:hypothetical protein
MTDLYKIDEINEKELEEMFANYFKGLDESELQEVYERLLLQFTDDVNTFLNEQGKQ